MVHEGVVVSGVVFFYLEVPKREAALMSSLVSLLSEAELSTVDACTAPHSPKERPVRAISFKAHSYEVLLEISDLTQALFSASDRHAPAALCHTRRLLLSPIRSCLQPALDQPTPLQPAKSVVLQ